ncbi:MAG: hypothetical protein ACREFO_01210 [Acetobacteraceae bacterium]
MAGTQTLARAGAGSVLAGLATGTARKIDLDRLTALRAPAIKALLESGALELSLFDQRDMASITTPEFAGERLVVCRNPDLVVPDPTDYGNVVPSWAVSREGPSTLGNLPVLGPAPGRSGPLLALGHGHFGIAGGPPSARFVARMITGQAVGIDPEPYTAQRFR